MRESLLCGWVGSKNDRCFDDHFECLTHTANLFGWEDKDPGSVGMFVIMRFSKVADFSSRSSKS